MIGVGGRGAMSSLTVDSSNTTSVTPPGKSELVYLLRKKNF